MVDGQQVTTWITDPTRFDVGNVDLHSLLLAPAERADVIVDFSQFAGKTLILYNDAPAAFPARVPSYDYYTGAPDLSPMAQPRSSPATARTPARSCRSRSLGNPCPCLQLGSRCRPPSPTRRWFRRVRVRPAPHHRRSGRVQLRLRQQLRRQRQLQRSQQHLQRCDGFVRVNDYSVFGFNTLLARPPR